MKPNKDGKTPNTKKPSLWDNITLVLVLAVVILVPLFVCIVLPILSLNMYADCKAANNMVVANRWLLAFCGSVLLDFLLIVCIPAHYCFKKMDGPTFWRPRSFLG